MFLIFWFSKKDHTAATTGAANLGGYSSLAHGHANQFFNHGRADFRSVGFAQLPLFTNQLGYLLPVCHGKRMMHVSRNLADALKVMEDFLVAVNVLFKNFPVVNTRLAWRSGINQHK